MESEMLSGIAQKAERTVEWKKQSVISTGISRETPCTRDPVYARPRAITQKGQGCELCVQGGNCPCLTRAGITVHSCEHP